MDPGYWKSKEFVVAATVAVTIVLLTGTILAVGTLQGVTFDGASCGGSPLGGTALAVPVTHTRITKGSDSVVRTVEHTLPPQNHTLGELQLCTETGAIMVKPSRDDQVRLTLTITGKGGRADEIAEGIKVAVSAATRDDTFLLSAHQSTSPSWFSRLFGGSSDGEVRIDLEVPAGARYGVRAATDTGRITVTNLSLSTSRLATDVGRITATGLDLQGDLTATSDTGSLTLQVTRLQSGKLTLGSDVGSITARLPHGDELGYDVHADSGTGKIRVDLSGAGSEPARGQASSGTVSAQTPGYAEKPVKVRVDASVATGNIEISTG